ncbi:MAG: sialidase [Pseudomonadota bacterium]
MLFALLTAAGPQPAVAQSGPGGGVRDQLPLRSIGPAGMSGRITSIAVAPTDRDLWFIGTASGGLWKTEDAGISFLPVFDEQPVQSIGAVAVAPTNPDVIYVGTGEGNPRNSQTSGNGVYKSSDGGRSWVHLGLAVTRNIHRIIVHPRDENVVWLGALGDPFAASESRGVYKSVDGGKRWRRVLYSNARSGSADLVLDPVNPNKLFAALWEFRRSPWDASSGGAGSGLFMSEDGGESWVALGADAGLPAGPLGRIGIAIAASQRERVYALVEAAQSALYRSEDGGRSWARINTETIGSRPFYFAELYVDTRNENRVYNLYSRLARSEDGGETFEVIEDWGRELHADYHAFWIDPEDSDFIIAGTDGGLYWTRDRGEHWRFAENLPLGQFYHLAVDDALPYRVYGGLQDNGTWYGPSEVWHRAGIRNAYWHEIAFNDGFDVVLDQADQDTVYALWQAGMLVRVNLATGQRKTITPAFEGAPLRFNWNAALAGDPHTPGRLYIGSQFLHRSEDRGDTWRRISPDLTSNDPTRQRQTESGGLSIDATGAENHTTITAIAPSPIEPGLIWVGTDDGRLHLTRDGGSAWEDLSNNMNGVPEGGWLRQVTPSRVDPAEAFVVIDNHLQGDTRPYLFHTRDFGRTWQNLVAQAGLPAFALSFVQDPEQPRLMFLGTEHGLYVSLDGGAAWERWRAAYPAVSTTDLAIQNRERDLVVASFGRSIWILDDIEPWRELARDPGLRKRQLHVFDPPPAYQVVIDQAPGQRLAPDHLYAGDNNARQALISFWVGDETIAGVDVAIERNGEIVHEWSMETTPGLNRTAWDQQWHGREIYGPLMSPDLERPLAPPGAYRVVLRGANIASSAALSLRPDPRVAYDAQIYENNHAFRRRLESLQEDADAALQTLECLELELAASTLEETQREPLEAELMALWNRLAFRGYQGTISDSQRLQHRLSRAFYFTHSPYEPLTPNDRAMLQNLEAQSGHLADALKNFGQALGANGIDATVEACGKNGG